MTRKLTERFGITTPLTPYHEHNAALARPVILRHLSAGGSVALVSDAGTPADFRPRLQAGARGLRRRPCRPHPARAVVGAGGADAGGAAHRPLLLRGLPALAARRAARAARRAGAARGHASCCWRPAAGWRTAWQIWPKSSAARDAAICRELTKLHEEVRRGGLVRARRERRGAGDPRRVRAGDRAAGPRRAGDVAGRARRSCCEPRLKRDSVKDAVAHAVEVSGRPRREVYARALALANEGGDGEA